MHACGHVAAQFHFHRTTNILAAWPTLNIGIHTHASINTQRRTFFLINIKVLRTKQRFCFRLFVINIILDIIRVWHYKKNLRFNLLFFVQIKKTENNRHITPCIMEYATMYTKCSYLGQKDFSASISKIILVALWYEK